MNDPAATADRLRHDLAMAAQDADRYVRGLQVILCDRLPSRVMEQGITALDDLMRQLTQLLGSLEMARMTLKKIRAQGVGL